MEQIRLELKELNNLKVRSVNITGYCDDQGSISYNKNLAQRRVATTSRLLHSMGIDSTHIAKKTAFGSKELVYGPLANSIELQRQLNRKVQIVVWALQRKTQKRKAPILMSSKVWMEPRKVNKEIPEAPSRPSRVGGILFVPGTTDILPESQFAMNLLLKTMKTHPLSMAKIEGHIWHPGGYGDAFNRRSNSFDLSFGRAKVVAMYLTSHGIEPNRISYIGLQNYVPTSKGAKYDRRVEVKLTYKENLAQTH